MAGPVRRCYKNPSLQNQFKFMSAPLFMEVKKIVGLWMLDICHKNNHALFSPDIGLTVIVVCFAPKKSRNNHQFVPI